MPKVDVEELARSLHHDVVGVSVADAENVCRDAIAGTGEAEVVSGDLPLLRRRVRRPEPIGDRILANHRERAAFAFHDLARRLRVEDDLDHPHLVAGGGHTVRGEAQIVSAVLPDAVHDADELEREDVLPQVVAALEHDEDGVRHRLDVLEREPERELLRVHVLALLDDESVHDEAWVDRELDASARELELGELGAEHLQTRLLRRVLDEHRYPLERLQDVQLLLELAAVLAAPAEVRLEQHAVPHAHRRHVHLRAEQPVQAEADLVAVHQRAAEDELRERRRVRRLVLEDLHELEQDLLHLRVGQALEAARRVPAHFLVGELRVEQLQREVRRQLGPPAQQAVRLPHGVRVRPLDRAQQLRQPGRLLRDDLAVAPDDLPLPRRQRVERVLAVHHPLEQLEVVRAGRGEAPRPGLDGDRQGVKVRRRRELDDLVRPAYLDVEHRGVLGVRVLDGAPDGVRLVVPELERVLAGEEAHLVVEQLRGDPPDRVVLLPGPRRGDALGEVRDEDGEEEPRLARDVADGDLEHEPLVQLADGAVAGEELPGLLRHERHRRAVAPALRRRDGAVEGVRQDGDAVHRRADQGAAEEEARLEVDGLALHPLDVRDVLHGKHLDAEHVADVGRVDDRRGVGRLAPHVAPEHEVQHVVLEHVLRELLVRDERLVVQHAAVDERQLHGGVLAARREAHVVVVAEPHLLELVVVRHDELVEPRRLEHVPLRAVVLDALRVHRGLHPARVDVLDDVGDVRVCTEHEAVRLVLVPGVDDVERHVLLDDVFGDRRLRFGVHVRHFLAHILARQPHVVGVSGVALGHLGVLGELAQRRGKLRTCVVHLLAAVAEEEPVRVRDELVCCDLVAENTRQFGEGEHLGRSCRRCAYLERHVHPVHDEELGERRAC